MDLDSSISSTVSNINMHLAKPWTVFYKLSIIWKSDLSNKINRNFSWTVVVSILLYGCTTWTLTKCIEKKLDGNCKRMLQAIVNESWKQHSMKQHLYGHQTPISKTIQIWQTRYAGPSWKSKDKLISNVLLWTPAQRNASVGQTTRTYIQHLCMDTRCRLEDLLEVMDNREEWQERIRKIHASRMMTKLISCPAYSNELFCQGLKC